jgi:TRAP-type C4-dicarboxylate transport system substrate-binding protein
MRRLRSGCSFVLMRVPFWVPLLLIAPLALAGCRSGSDKAGGKPARKATVLTLAVPGDPWEVNGFADEVSRLSHGTMRIAVRARWRWGQVAYENGLIADVRAGKLDLGAAGSRAWDSVGVTSLRALSAPLLIDSYALQDQVLRSSMIEEMLRGLRPLGLVGLGVLPGQLPRPLGISHPLLERSDYVGRRIGVQQSLVGSATMRGFGATPVWFAGGASIAGLDGIQQPISSIQGSGYDGVGKYLTTNVVLWARPIVLFANRAAFARLRPDEQRLLKQAVTEDVRGQTKVVVGFERFDTEALCAHGRLRFVAARPIDLATVHRAVQPVYKQLERNPQTRRFITEIRALRVRVAAPPSIVPSCRGGGLVSAPTLATPVDGVYALTVASGDLAVSRRIPEAYGSWQIVLDRGRFRFSQRSDHADWIADGQVRVSGDEMSWTVVDALDVGPHGVPDGIPLRRGETLRFRWRRSGKGLVLASADARPALPALSVRPLARVADAPSQQPLENPAVLQGAWVANPTAADVIDHGGNPASIPDNTGPLRLAVHGSHCRWTQHAPDGDNWGVGTCRFAGDTLELDLTRTDDNASPTPMFLRWSVYHRRLTFRQAPGFSPEEWTYQPWRKVA